MYEYPMKIGLGYYVSSIGGFSEEICAIFDESEEIIDTGVGINSKYLQKSGIKPYKKCVITPVDKGYNTIEIVCEVIPLYQDIYPESVYLSGEGEMVLPKIYEGIFRENDKMILNFVPFIK
ncbi:MAG: hypothetical protein B6U88_02125 [Candidatus Aenigmarchaeota archaeon ex4484_56]|nr:MAG: hypothetical protein B6U88_02125 [Candidatus Aenigmarchaeota archaeon ex4484_56]